MSENVWARGPSEVEQQFIDRGGVMVGDTFRFDGRTYRITRFIDAAHFEFEEVR